MSDRPKRIIFLGTPAPSVPPLRALYAAGYHIPLVVSRPDKRRGRGGELSPSPVKAAARELGLPVTDRIDDVLGVQADLGVVVAYGRIIGTDILAHVPMVNIHFSLLPRWRGAAPVERSVMAGDTETGVCLMGVAEGLDTGDVYRQRATPIGPDETAAELFERLVPMGTDLLMEALAEGLGAGETQEGEVTYAEKLSTSDLELDWNRPARELHDIVRVGGAWTTYRGERLKVWRSQPTDDELAPGVIDGTRVGTGDGVLELIEVQKEGKARQQASAWVNGARPAPGETLGS